MTNPAQVSNFVRDIIEVNGRVAIDRVFVRGRKLADRFKARELRTKKSTFQAYHWQAEIGMVVVLTARGNVLQLTIEEFWAAHAK